MNEHLASAPQWTTGSRLLQPGEAIEFNFHVPPGADASHLDIFPRYLEQADPGDAFVAGGDLAWLEALPSEQVALAFADGRATLLYKPDAPGNYIARWRAGKELFYRYFAVIEDDWTVLRFAAYRRFEVDPTLHATGIPLDYRLPIEHYEIEDPLFQRRLADHRHFGDAVVPVLPDTPDTTSESRLSTDDRVRIYAPMMERVRSLLVDQSDARSARIEMYHEADPGYIEVMARLGLNNHFGLREANCAPWTGMPEFPYFGSPVDCRKTNQGNGGDVIVNQWDFCGGFHFLGPIGSHYNQAEGDFARSLECFHQCMQEAQNLTQMSGHPAFILPLYMARDLEKRTPNPLWAPEFQATWEEGIGPFIERYQRCIAFEFTKQYKVAFARSIDIADYFRRRFEVTPRTVFVSKTDHFLYEHPWFCTWNNDRYIVPRQRIPWNTRISSVMQRRRNDSFRHKDPLSQEYILIEDQKRSIRFERECANPIWFFDYTLQERGPLGSTITHIETPDVDVRRSHWHDGDGELSIELKVFTEATFQDYAIALWGLPDAFSPEQYEIQTNAKEHVLAWNTDGEHHLVLFFDLEPDRELKVVCRRLRLERSTSNKPPLV